MNLTRRGFTAGALGASVALQLPSRAFAQQPAALGPGDGRDQRVRRGAHAPFRASRADPWADHARRLRTSAQLRLRQSRHAASDRRRNPVPDRLHQQGHGRRAAPPVRGRGTICTDRPGQRLAARNPAAARQCDHRPAFARPCRRPARRRPDLPRRRAVDRVTGRASIGIIRTPATTSSASSRRSSAASRSTACSTSGSSRRSACAGRAGRSSPPTGCSTRKAMKPRTRPSHSRAVRRSPRPPGSTWSRPARLSPRPRTT